MFYFWEEFEYINKLRASATLIQIFKFGTDYPEKVYLTIPSGVVWIGTFNKDSGSIEGLHKMISFYDMKEYNLCVLQYVGGPNFNLLFLTAMSWKLITLSV